MLDVVRPESGVSGEGGARFRARDLLLVPGLLSLSRLALAAASPFALSRPAAGLGILLAAGASDVLDGWYARRFGCTTATGAVLDPITDKIFVLTFAVALVAGGNMPLPVALLLGTRELGEIPLALWVLRRGRRNARSTPPAVNTTGKVVTVLQFGTLCSAVIHAPFTVALAVITAIVGCVASFSYIRRVAGSTSGRR